VLRAVCCVRCALEASMSHCGGFINQMANSTFFGANSNKLQEGLTVYRNYRKLFNRLPVNSPSALLIGSLKEQKESEE
jgi:hypothetical protein